MKGGPAGIYGLQGMEWGPAGVCGLEGMEEGPDHQPILSGAQGPEAWQRPPGGPRALASLAWVAAVSSSLGGRVQSFQPVLITRSVSGADSQADATRDLQ